MNALGLVFVFLLTGRDLLAIPSELEQRLFPDSGYVGDPIRFRLLSALNKDLKDPASPGGGGGGGGGSVELEMSADMIAAREHVLKVYREAEARLKSAGAPPWCENLLRNCLQTDPQQRPPLDILVKVFVGMRTYARKNHPLPALWEADRREEQGLLLRVRSDYQPAMKWAAEKKMRSEYETTGFVYFKVPSKQLKEVEQAFYSFSPPQGPRRSNSGLSVPSITSPATTPVSQRNNGGGGGGGGDAGSPELSPHLLRSVPSEKDLEKKKRGERERQLTITRGLERSVKAQRGDFENASGGPTGPDADAGSDAASSGDAGSDAADSDAVGNDAAGGGAGRMGWRCTAPHCQYYFNVTGKCDSCNEPRNGAPFDTPLDDDDEADVTVEGRGLCGGALAAVDETGAGRTPSSGEAGGGAQ